MKPPSLTQVAFSVTDLNRTCQWYKDVFGFQPGGSYKVRRGLLSFLSSRVQGLPNVTFTMQTLVGQQEFSNLEFFQFRSPMARPLPPDWQACDVGYSMMGLHVINFDGALERLEAAGTKPLTTPMGDRGARRVCVRDPEGVIVEVMEDDPRCPGAMGRARPEEPVALRSITLSVPDLERSRRLFVDTLCLTEVNGYTLHQPKHEALWRLAGANRKALLLWAGDFLVEIVQYLDPPGKPWPEDYRISDQGILNIAFGYRKKSDFNALYRQMIDAGYKGNCSPLIGLGSGGLYMNDDQGFSFEILYSAAWAEGFIGYRPKTISFEVKTWIGAPRDIVWGRIADHEGMTAWSMFDEILVTREGKGDRNGLGAIRLMRGRGMELEEVVVDWNPMEGYDYRLISPGGPVSDHYGRVRLNDLADGTEVSWTVRFRPARWGTGRIIRTYLSRVFKRGLEDLKHNIENMQSIS